MAVNLSLNSQEFDEYLVDTYEDIGREILQKIKDL